MYLYAFLFYFLDVLSQNLFLENKIELSEKLVSTFHAIVSITRSVAILQDKSFWSDHIAYYSDQSISLINFSCAYFLYDSVICILRGCKADFVIHGLFCFVVYNVIRIHKIMHFHGAFLLLWETSTIFLNSRYMIRHFKLGNKILLYNNVLFLVAFVCFRLLWGGYGFILYISDMYFHEHNFSSFLVVLFTTIYISLYTLNWIWMFFILKKI